MKNGIFAALSCFENIGFIIENKALFCSKNIVFIKPGKDLIKFKFLSE